VEVPIAQYNSQCGNLKHADHSIYIGTSFNISRMQLHFLPIIFPTIMTPQNRAYEWHQVLLYYANYSFGGTGSYLTIG